MPQVLRGKCSQNTDSHCTARIDVVTFLPVQIEHVRHTSHLTNDQINNHPADAGEYTDITQNKYCMEREEADY